MHPSCPPLAVCSWSLLAPDAGALAERVLATGVSAVQLHLDPLRGAGDPLEAIRPLLDAGIAIVSGMMTPLGEDYGTIESIRRTGGLRPNEHWEANLAAARADALIAERLGLDLVTLHAGFIPEDPGDPERAVFLERLGLVADAFGERGVRLGLETGQESAACLAEVLGELGRPGVGVNFDPANMILYGSGDPLAALEVLGPWVMQAHVKDARASGVPGAWGEEVVAGTGEVDWPAFFGTLDRVAPGVGLAIEREAGEDRVADASEAARLVRAFRPGA